MSKRAGALSAGLTIMALAGAAMVSLGTSPAHAVVYCKTVGVPKGCVVRPDAAVVVAPVEKPPVAHVEPAAPTKSALLTEVSRLEKRVKSSSRKLKVSANSAPSLGAVYRYQDVPPVGRHPLGSDGSRVAPAASVRAVNGRDVIV